MFAPMSTFLKRFNVREDSKPVPLGFAYSQSMACGLLAVKVNGKCVTNLVQVNKCVKS